MSETGFRRLAFNTRDLPERDRAGQFCDAIGHGLLRIEVDPQPDSVLDAAMTFLQLPGVGVAEGHLSAMRCRHLAHLADNDDLVLVAMPQGAALVEQRGREVVIAGGAATLTANGERGAITAKAPTRVVNIRLSRKLLVPLLAGGDTALARPIPAETPALRLLMSYVDVLKDEQALASPALCRIAAAHMYDLAALALGATRDAAEAATNGGLRAARRAGLLRKIESRLGDPALTAATLAAELGISRRHVSRLFEETGQTFSEYVLEERLVRAANLLRDKHHDHRKIADIAFAVGFVDLSHFNRSFRRRFGATPTDVRAGARLRRE